MLINYISSKEVIGRFLKEYGIETTSYVEDMYQWIEDAIEIIGISNYYVVRSDVKKVINGRAKLPCDIQNLYGVWVSSGLIDRPSTSNLYSLTLRNSPALAGSATKAGHQGAYGTVNGSFLYTSFSEGYVYYMYSGVPCDCDGFPLVPKDTKVIHALQYYFLWRMGLSGHIHPVIGVSDAMKLWEKAYPAASNSVNWMDLQDYQEFTAMWTNALRNDLNSNYYIV